MRPADRLFQIVLQLGRGRVLTAKTLAEQLEVSERTIYRDIADLMASRVAGPDLWRPGDQALG